MSFNTSRGRENFLPPLSQVIAVLVYIISVTSISPYKPELLLGMSIFPIIYASLTETHFRLIMKKVLPLLPFILFIGIGNIWSNTTLYGIYYGIHITYGWVSSFTLTVKALLTVSALGTLSYSVGIMECVAALMKIGFPSEMGMELIMMFRYIGELKHDVVTMQNAYRTRSNKSRIPFKDVGTFVTAFFLKCVGRSSRVAHAMKTRGFTVKNFTISERKMSRSEKEQSFFFVIFAIMFRFIPVVSIIGDWVIH